MLRSAALPPSSRAADGETRGAEIERLEGLLDFLKSNESGVRDCLGAAPAEELRRTLRALTAGLQFLEAGKDGPASASWQEVCATRRNHVSADG